MIDWDTVTPALKEWVRKASGVQQVFFQNEKRPFTQSVWCQLRVVSITSYDMDDSGFIEVPAPNNTIVQRQFVRGQRTFALEVKFFSIRQDNGGVADTPLELLRTRNQLDTVSAILSVVACAVSSMGPSQVTDQLIDDRMFSVWVAQVNINCAFEYIDTDPSPEADTYSIEAVEGSGSFNNSPEIPFSVGTPYTAQTTDNTPLELLPRKVVPLGPGLLELVYKVIATDTVTKKNKRWVVRATVRYETVVSLETETLFEESSGVLWAVAVSNPTGRELALVGVGDATNPVDWVISVLEQRLL